ncbi:molybdenum cofactor biosynthesis protein MoaA [Cutibacterium acnes JCM 18909]|nr:molybdenum cofactor biosynthesis protein MoaA [Cutibacterium acnes JCM 18909]
MSAATGQSATHHGLPDRFGRLATDLRVSVTDHCNLRCTYCMPAEDMDWLANRDLLTDERSSVSLASGSSDWASPR